MKNRTEDQIATAHMVAMGRRLRQARKALGITGEQLAELIGGDATKQKISNYETAQDRPPHLFLKRLEAETGITASWVIAGTRWTLPGNIRDKVPPSLT